MHRTIVHDLFMAHNAVAGIALKPLQKRQRLGEVMNVEGPVLVGLPANKAFVFVSSTYSEDVVDPYPMFRELRTTTPVMDGDILASFNVPSQAGYSNTGRRVFTLFRHEHIRQVLADTQTYTARLLNDGRSVFWGEGSWTSEDGNSHRRMRTLLAPCFNPALMRRRSVEMIEPVVREIYARPLVSQKSCDLIVDFALPGMRHLQLSRLPRRSGRCGEVRQLGPAHPGRGAA